LRAIQVDSGGVVG